MKNLSLILNFILVIAVGVLFYLHFSGKPSGQSVEKPAEETSQTPGSETKPSPVDTNALFSGPVNLPASTNPNGTIAYINLDQFFAKYEFYKQGVKDIERSITSKRSQLMEKQKQLEEDFQRYQQAAATYTDAQRKSREQVLMQQEQDLFQLRDQLEEQQANEMNRFNENLLKKVDDYFKNLGKGQNYNYVFTYTKGGPATIVYAKDSLDITTEVVDALNAQYKKKK